jgi:hypothetical protein
MRAGNSGCAACNFLALERLDGSKIRTSHELRFESGSRGPPFLNPGRTRLFGDVLSNSHAAHGQAVHCGSELTTGLACQARTGTMLRWRNYATFHRRRHPSEYARFGRGTGTVHAAWVDMRLVLKGAPQTALCPLSNRSLHPRNGNWKTANRDRRPKPAPHGPNTGNRRPETGAPEPNPRE